MASAVTVAFGFSDSTEVQGVTDPCTMRSAPTRAHPTCRLASQNRAQTYTNDFTLKMMEMVDKLCKGFIEINGSPRISEMLPDTLRLCAQLCAQSTAIVPRSASFWPQGYRFLKV